MEIEERFTLIEKRLNMIEDEIERIQKDIQILGENTKIETPCFVTFENSLTKKLIKENENSNTSPTISS
jgi:Na+/phosphate symporter